MDNHERLEKTMDEDRSGYLNEDERRHLLADLHRVLVWVGVKVPERLPVDEELLRDEMQKDDLTGKDLFPEVHLVEGSVDLHELIWRLIHKDNLTAVERLEIQELIRLLEAEERQEEDVLKEEHLTHDEARRLYTETAGLIRALMDLKDLLRKREKSDARDEAIRRKVDDARRWKAFVDVVKDKGKLGV